MTRNELMAIMATIIWAAEHIAYETKRTSDYPRLTFSEMIELAEDFFYVCEKMDNNNDRTQK